MTTRQVFEATLIELSKVLAPSLKLYEFNYLFNKAINNYINKVYNVYDYNQQTTDDLRVLKSTAYLTPTKFNARNSATLAGGTTNASSSLSSAHSSIQSLHGATYEAFMPLDYLHLLNCVCIFYVAKTKDCWDAGSYIEIPANRLTADSWSLIITDIYNRPSPMRPYYYIHNLANLHGNNLPTNPNTTVNADLTTNGTDIGGLYKVTGSTISVESFKATKKSSGTLATYGPSGSTTNYVDGTVFYKGTDGKYYVTKQDTINHAANNKLDSNMSDTNYTITFIEYVVVDNPAGVNVATNNTEGSNFSRSLKLDLDGNGSLDTEVSLVEKPIGLRASNTSNVRIEVRYGKDDTLFQLKELQIDYVKSPQFIRLTQEQIDLTEDTSQIMEFPDYVNQEIINELVHLVMERTNDPRLSNNMSVDLTIARPTGLTQQPAPKA